MSIRTTYSYCERSIFTSDTMRISFFRISNFAKIYLSYVKNCESLPFALNLLRRADIFLRRVVFCCERLFCPCEGNFYECEGCVFAHPFAAKMYLFRSQKPAKGHPFTNFKIANLQIFGAKMSHFRCEGHCKDRPFAPLLNPLQILRTPSHPFRTLFTAAFFFHKQYCSPLV